MIGQRFDVFVSYNGDNRTQAEDIAIEMRNLGLRVWFDRWELRPGQPWLKGIYKALGESNSTVLLIGSSGIGDWQKTEAMEALQNYVRDGWPVITVMLPGGEECEEDVRKLSFLKWDDRYELEFERISQESFNRLVWGITGKKSEGMILQSGKQFQLHTWGFSGPIEVRPLPNPNPGSLLNLSWTTLGEGISDIQNHLSSHLPSFNAYFGINETGLVIATFLSGSTRKRPKIGYIRFERTTDGIRMLDDSFFPELPQSEPAILLVDFELKTGGALNFVIKEIRKKYKNKRLRICFAAFGALTDEAKLELESLCELKAACNLKKLEIENFLTAYTMHHPGIEPPLGLR